MLLHISFELVILYLDAHNYTLLSIDMLEKIDDTGIDEDTIVDIIEMLEHFDIRKLRTLATNLGLEDSSMNTIMRENSNSFVIILQNALTEWLQLNYDYEKNGKPSWRKLAKAVRPLNGNIFEKIVSMYPGNIAS